MSYPTFEDRYGQQPNQAPNPAFPAGAGGIADQQQQQPAQPIQASPWTQMLDPWELDARNDRQASVAIGGKA